MTRAPGVNLAGGRVEVLDLGGDPARPAVVLLHEGLGSVGLWRGFPERLHAATGSRTIAYSRFGHGRSSPPPRPRTPAFMHEEAREVLPVLLSALGVDRPVLVGHSDGASIALIHAAEHEVAGVVALAPHAFVEAMGLSAIEATRDTFATGGLRDRMARHHDDPDITFSGWSGVWLDPAFRAWTLVPLLEGITAPVLLVQGRDDAYGTLAQLDAIERGVRGPVERLVVAGGHAPHLEHPQQILAAAARFIGQRPAPAA